MPSLPGLEYAARSLAVGLSYLISACGSTPSGEGGDSSGMGTAASMDAASAEDDGTDAEATDTETGTQDSDSSSTDATTGTPPDLPQEPAIPPCGLEVRTLAEFATDSVWPGDVDDDGYLDLITVERQGETDRVNLYLGDGQGDFDFTAFDGIDIPVPSEWSQRIVAGDLMGGPGHGLLALRDTSSPRTYALQSYLFDPADGFHEVEAQPIERMFTHHHRLEDVNADGSADLITGQGHSEPIRVWFGSTKGVFAEPISLPRPACYVTDFDWSDIDGDDDLDLLAVGGCNSYDGFRYVSVYLQGEPGEFSLPDNLPDDLPQTFSENLHFVRAGEFDGQPGRDIVTQPGEAWLEKRLGLNSGVGGGLPSAYEVIELDNSHVALEVVDLDVDGLDDLIAEKLGSLLWLRNIGGDFELCSIADGVELGTIGKFPQDAPPQLILRGDEGGLFIVGVP